MFGREKTNWRPQGLRCQLAPRVMFSRFSRKERKGSTRRKKKKDDTEENLYKVRKVSSNCLEKRSHQSTAGPLQNAFYFPLWYLRIFTKTIKS